MSDREPSPTTDDLHTPDPVSLSTRKPSLLSIPRGWVITTAALVLLSACAAVTFGVLWQSSISKAHDARRASVEVKWQLTDVEGKLTSAEDDLEALQARMIEFERDAKYTACVQYQGGFMMGQGIGASLAVEWSKENCVAESLWKFDIKPAP